MHCPNCGNSLVTKGKFCPYCGSSVPEDIVVKIDSRQEIVDHARMEEAKGRPVETKEREKTKRRIGCLTVIIAIIAAVVILAVYYEQSDRIRRSSYSSSSSTSIFAEEKARHQKEITRLQRVEDEILEDIRNERYEQALLKAQTLYYTDSWSKESKEAWDKKREALIKQLNELLGKEETAGVETSQ